MILKINGVEVCVSSATYSKGGAHNVETISAMSSCGEPIAVKRGDLLTMVAVYDLAKHPLYDF